MIIAFCGHSNMYGVEKLDDKIMEILEREIRNQAVDFYLGGYGGFDGIAKSCCKQYQKSHANAKLFFVTPYIDEVYLKNRADMIDTYDGVIYPELERVPKRFAIIERNKWMVRQATLVIAYVDYSWGGAVKTLDYAHKIKTRYVNLGSYRYIE